LDAKQKEIEKRDLWIGYAIAALAGACRSDSHLDQMIELITRQSGHAAREIDKRYLAREG
jgi:menaquinone-dependent protoporphyrinogen IX oxidase